MTDIEKIQHKLADQLKPGRFTHTLGVMYTAASLAMCHGEDIHKTMLAGLLHDCGKYGSEKEQIKLCEQYKIKLNKSELKMPALVHAKLGAYLARKVYNIKDADILSAITYHTTGRPEMTLLEKIIYISDFIEPKRKEIPILNEVRKSAFLNLEKAVYLCAQSTVSYLDNTEKSIDPMTIQTLEYYQVNKK